MSIETTLDLGLAVEEYKKAVMGISASVRERIGKSMYYRSDNSFGVEFWTPEEKKKVRDAFSEVCKTQEALGVPPEERFSPFGWGIWKDSNY